MWHKKYDGYRIFVRDFTESFSYEDVNFSNRGGALFDIDNSLEQKCFLPFYKCVIDFDAKVQFCNNDWIYKYEIGDLKKNSLKNIWLSEEMMKFRKILSKGEREKIKMCRNCDVNGNLIGRKSFNYFKENYEL